MPFYSKTASSKKITHAYIFTLNKDVGKSNANRDSLQAFFPDRSTIVNVILNDPFSYFQSFVDIISKIYNQDIKRILIDISTFTHEMLLILLKVLHQKKHLFDKIEFLYVGASEYSVGDDEEHMWLSKGCKDVRTVLGYPGIIFPNKPICLILLVGFEHERAMGLINSMDPDQILMGCGLTGTNDVMSDSHINPMLFFEKMFKSLLSSRNNVKQFSFSVKNIEDTVNKIKEQIDNTKEFNHIIVPLNTKTSTLATGIIALEDPTVQLCYAEPDEYNVENYSSPSNRILKFTWWQKNDTTLVVS